MLKLTIALCCFLLVGARVDMLQTDVELLNEHPMKPQNVTMDQLNTIITQEWLKMVAFCVPDLDITAKISASFDETLVGTNTLAWASSTLLLLNDVWQPSLTYSFYEGNDFVMGVNPMPPNGWYIGSIDGDCSDISYRYDLRTVLRHEMVHGIGMGTSIRSNSLGYYSGSRCYPTKYDTKIEDAFGNKVVDGCTRKDITGKNLYVNGVKLFNPSTYLEGSSLSHHAFADQLMYWRLSPSRCMDLGSNELKILSGIGVDCPLHPQYSSAAQKVLPKLHLVIPLLLLLYGI